MAWVPFSKSKFEDKGLSKVNNMSVYKTTVAAPIYRFELANAVSQMPLVFVESDSRFIFCASNADLDLAIQLKPEIDNFLMQRETQRKS